MPRISEFYGIEIYMYPDDHPPPHCHAWYSGDWAVISLATGEPLDGSLPKRALRLVRQWAKEHRSELYMNWDRVRNREAPKPVEPLR